MTSKDIVLSDLGDVDSKITNENNLEMDKISKDIKLIKDIGFDISKDVCNNDFVHIDKNTTRTVSKANNITLSLREVELKQENLNISKTIISVALVTGSVLMPCFLGIKGLILSTIGIASFVGINLN